MAILETCRRRTTAVRAAPAEYPPHRTLSSTEHATPRAALSIPAPKTATRPALAHTYPMFGSQLT